MNSPKVFLCHVKEDESIIKSIDKSLTKHGIDVIVDYKYPEGGLNLETKFEKLIDESDYFILCFSKEFEKREESQAYFELNYAIKRAKYIAFWKRYIFAVKINKCNIEKISKEIRANENLDNIERYNLFSPAQFENSIKSIVKIIKDEQLENETNDKTKKHNKNDRYVGYVEEQRRLNRIISDRIDHCPIDMSPLDFIKSLPQIKSELLQEIKIILDSKTPKGGTTADICNIRALYIDALQKILTKLASFYSPDYFIDQSPQDFFSEIIDSRKPFHGMTAESGGPGTGGTIRSIFYISSITQDVENLIKDMIVGLLFPSPQYSDFDYKNWIKLWRNQT